MPGITTWAEPREAVWLRENATAETVQIGVYDDSLPGTENKMVRCSGALESYGVSALQRCVCVDSEWICIDEIGYLECQVPEYTQAIWELMEIKRLAAVVRKQDLPFLNALCSREDVFLVDLDAPFGNVGCVIMASGLGRRFGGNKLMAEFDGEPMLCRILDATEKLFHRRVVVTRSSDAAELCRERGISAVLHELPFRSDTVRLGLKAIGPVDRCMFCPADQPLLCLDTIAALLLSSANDSASIWRPACGGTPGAPILFPKWTFSELLTLPEGKGGGVIAKRYPERVRTVEVSDAFELMDADTPEELHVLRERIAVMK